VLIGSPVRYPRCADFLAPRSGRGREKIGRLTICLCETAQWNLRMIVHFNFVFPSSSLKIVLVS